MPCKCEELLQDLVSKVSDKKGNMKCPICHSSDTEVLNIKHAFFRHLDFATVKPSGCIGRCSTCQSLFNVVNDKTITDINNLFESRDYALSRQTQQTLILKGYKEPVTRSFLQAELLCKLLNKGQPSILDIGCFDGRLLNELNCRFNSADLHGFDINEHLRLVFPTKDNFHFWPSDIECVKGGFDLICMSHTLAYVKDIPCLMKQIKRLIKPDGLLFIQTPDISKNLCYILMGDQYYHYTANILKNTLRNFGFEFSSLDNNWFPREVVGIAKLASHRATIRHIKDLQIYECIRYLNDTAARLNEILNSSPIGVLGTTVNAAFVDEVLGNKVTFFADENCSRVGSVFRNKKVLHPQSLADSDLLIIPYGESCQPIKERFEKEYRGQFMSL